MTALAPYTTHAPLSEAEAEAAIGAILDGGAEDAEIAAFLTHLAERGESVTEIVGAARALRARVVPIQAPPGAVDCCGTGGDGAHSLNISTAVALVLAACGVPVAKHGGRAASSKCGAADVLEALGVRLDVPRQAQERALREIGFAFLFAPAHHAAMARVAPVRRALGRRTIFNLIGPLANPAGAPYQLMGVFAPQWCAPMAGALAALGSRAAWVVHGAEGLDEISISGPTRVVRLANGAVHAPEMLTPADFGLRAHPANAIAGGDAQHNATALTALLDGAPSAYRDCALANAAAALMLCGQTPSLPAGAEMAAQAIDSGRARGVLEGYIALTQQGDAP
jgi:anthranilate phosphoribosyltransferase